MYKNIGKKIRVLAQVLGWLFLIAGIITWMVLVDHDSVTGWVALATGVISFISSWILYGFGQLVDDIHAMRTDSLDEPAETPSNTPTKTPDGGPNETPIEYIVRSLKKQ